MTTETQTAPVDASKGGDAAVVASAGGFVGDAASSAAAAAKTAADAAAATPEGKAAAEKVTADAKAAADKANAIELKLPKGFDEKAPAVGAIRDLAKDLGLKSDGGQKILDALVKVQAAEAKAQETALEQQDKAWAKAIADDKEIGGANLPAAKIAVGKVFTKFDPTGVAAKVFAASGLGNEPSIVKFIHAIGKSLAEDTITQGSDKGAPGAKGNKSAQLKALFDRSPTMKFED